MMFKKKTFMIVMFLAVGISWSVVACSKKTTAPTIKSVQVTRQTLTLSVLSNGNVQPENRVEIKPPVAGRVERVLVSEGQLVDKGQILAYLSSSERAALLDAARAKGKEEVAHWEELYKATPLLAPLNGQIIARNVEPGQTVGASDTVLVLSDHLIVNAQVDETDIGKIKVGQKAILMLDAYPDQPIEAKVNHIGFEAKTVNNVTIYDVYVMPMKIPEFMRSGMTADVTFITEQKENILVVPSEAVKQQDGKNMVLLPGDGKRPNQQEIVTGITDGKVTEVVSGLDEGATVLVSQFTLPGKSGGVTGTNPFMPARPAKGGAAGAARAH